MVRINCQTICQDLLKDLSERQKEVIKRRFGLTKNQQKETLQKIGKDFAVTRERIRQIQEDALKKIRPKILKEPTQSLINYLKEALKKTGGLKKEDLFLENLPEIGTANQIRFLLILDDSFCYQPQNKQCYSFWALNQSLIVKAKQEIRKLYLILKKEKKSVSFETILQYLDPEHPKTSQSILEIAKKIERGPLGKYGLIEWPEIRARGARDRAYLALKKEGRPLHFREIAKVANTMVCSNQNSKPRKVLPQTVHNELTRDPRFVLVGRGIYALREWGYQEGSVQNIIYQVLKKANRPLSQQDIVEQVLSQRLVKENTILVNLRKEKKFIKDDNGNYILKDA